MVVLYGCDICKEGRLMRASQGNENVLLQVCLSLDITELVCEMCKGIENIMCRYKYISLLGRVVNEGVKE